MAHHLGRTLCLPPCRDGSRHSHSQGGYGNVRLQQRLAPKRKAKGGTACHAQHLAHPPRSKESVSPEDGTCDSCGSDKGNGGRRAEEGGSGGIEEGNIANQLIIV